MRLVPVVFVALVVACGTEPTVELVDVHRDAQAACQPEGATCMSLRGPWVGGAYVLELFAAERVMEEVNPFLVTRLSLPELTPREVIPLVMRVDRSLFFVRLVPDVHRAPLEVHKLGAPVAAARSLDSTDIEHELRTWNNIENINHKLGEPTATRPQPFFDEPNMRDLSANTPRCYESSPFFADGDLGLIDVHRCVDTAPIGERAGWDL